MYSSLKRPLLECVQFVAIARCNVRCCSSLARPSLLDGSGGDEEKSPDRIDHRHIGKQQKLFLQSPASPGSPIFLPDGAHVFSKLQAFLRAQNRKFGLKEVITPTIYKKSLWQVSGHWENYKDDMYAVVGRGASGRQDGEIGQHEEYGLKPMNCPGHCLIYKSAPRSYRDLPIRYADFSALHRNEIHGALSGLTRTRRFHQDDGHIFCRTDQISAEISQTLEYVSLVMDTFKLGPYRLVLSTRPEEHYIGEIEDWQHAEAQLRDALDASGKEWQVNAGDGAFYGPKIDVILADCNGKEFQTATVQLDFQLPRRFGLEYIQGHAGQAADAACGATKTTPVLVHRAIFGSIERFMALLIEHYEGHWPFWLSPRQAIIVSVSTKPEVLKCAWGMRDALSRATELKAGRPALMSDRVLQVDVDDSAEPLGHKLAKAKAEGYKMIIVCGTREAADSLEGVQVCVDATAQRECSATENILRQTVKRYEKGPIALRKVMMSICELRQFMLGLEDGYI